MNSKEAMNEIDKNIKEKGLKLKFGLEQQGLMPIVEEMLDSNCSWQEINRKIGWCGDAAQESYQRYARRKIKSLTAVLEETKELLKNGAGGAITDTVWCDSKIDITLYDKICCVTETE